MDISFTVSHLWLDVPPQAGLFRDPSPSLTSSSNMAGWARKQALSTLIGFSPFPFGDAVTFPSINYRDLLVKQAGTTIYQLGNQMTHISQWYTRLLFIVARQALWKIHSIMMYSTAKFFGFSHAKLISSVWFFLSQGYFAYQILLALV